MTVEPSGTPPPAAGGVSASRTVLGRGSLYTVATAGPALAAVAVIPVVTRVLPLAEYDLVAIATVVVQVGYVLVALGLGAAITRHYVLERSGAAGARRLVLQGSAIAVALAGAAAATAPAWSPAVLGRPAGPELLLALVACAGGAAMVLAQAFLRGADRAAAFVVLAVLTSLVGPLVGLLLVVLVSATAVVYTAGLAAGFVLAGAAGLVTVALTPHRTAGTAAPAAPAATAGPPPPDGRRAGLAAALRVGLPTVPHQVSLYLALAGLVVVADRLLDAGGRANVALTVGAGATVVTAGLNNAWAPLVYRTAPSDRGRVLTETTRTVGVVAVLLAGTVALLAPWLLRLMAPDAFGTAQLVPVVALACAAALPSVLYLASGHLVFARGRTEGLALTTPLAVAGGLATAALTVGPLGLVGVGLGYLVAYLLLAAGTTGLQRAVSDTPWWPPALPVLALLWVGSTALGALAPTDGAAALVRPLACVAMVVAGWVLVRRRSG